MSRIVKMQRRYGSEWYLENDEGHVSWVSPMVKEYIEKLETENTKLRKELELAGHIAVSNVAASIGREESLEAENDKLREELCDLWRFTKSACKKYPRLFDQSAQGGQMVQLNAIDAFEQSLQELGIEVPE